MLRDPNDIGRVVVIIQARMGSTRRPGKVLADIVGKPMLQRVVERVSNSKRIDDIVIATTTSSLDDPLIELSDALELKWYRGSELDLLDRYFHAASENNADAVVRITSDCPCADPEVIDHIIKVFEESDADYVSNTIEPRTYPRGLDVEIFSKSALEIAWKEDTRMDWREHVTPYFYRNPDKFHLIGVRLEGEDHSEIRLTVDTEEDLQLVRNIYSHFGGSIPGWREIISYLRLNQGLLSLNKHVVQKKVAD